MNVLTRVLLHPKYATIAVVIALSLIAFAVWLPNLPLIVDSLYSSSLTFREKIALLTSLLGSLETNFTAVSRLLLIISAFLTGIQVALVTYYVHQAIRWQRDMGVSFLAIGLSFLGIGCASCGSVLLATLFGFSAMASLVKPFPFKGQEFSVIGILLLLFAIKQTVIKVNSPLLCKVGRGYGEKI